MFIQLFEEIENQQEKEQYFEERTAHHIELVQKAAQKIADKFSQFSDLPEKAKEHDVSKYEEPERTPYIDLTWAQKLKNEQGREFDPSPEIQKATFHHVKHNSHHPEYHLKDKSEVIIDPKDRDKSKKCVDASNMPDIDLAEMVADWQAMSEELGTNTAREWYNKQKDVRWHFSEKQNKLIDELLRVFEENE